MFKWNKLGQVFNPIELKSQSWMKEYAQATSTVIFDSFVRIYFSSRPPRDENGQYISRLGFIDVKRDNLFQIIKICAEPVLALGEKGTFDEFGTNPVSVICTGDEIRAYYAGWTRCESVPFNAAIGIAISRDGGSTFERIGKGPVLSYSPDEPFVLGSPKIRRFNDAWYLWYSAGKKWIRNESRPEPIYKIRMAKSSDGIHWKKDGRDLIDDVLEENECQASADVFFYRGQYHMFFSYRYNLNFREADKGYRIGYASSNDLLNWIRDDSVAGISKSATGWDSESVSYAHVFELDGRIYMLYQGNEMGKNGFGLALLENGNQCDNRS
jgi:hypothetical protein